jgi:hypothetical protein
VANSDLLSRSKISLALLWNSYAVACASFSISYARASISCAAKRNNTAECAMLFNPKHEMSLERLEREARLAPTPTHDLLSKITCSACPRLQLLRSTGKPIQVDRSIEAGAWTDAAIALIKVELPGWQLRRLVYEDGEWLCSLSRQPNLPIERDDPADASHEVLALAILCAFVEALRRIARERKTPTATLQVKPGEEQPVSCDNFA